MVEFGPASNFNLGIIAAKKGLQESDNPYYLGSYAHEQWLDGFRAAHDEQYRGKRGPFVGKLIHEIPIYEQRS